MFAYDFTQYYDVLVVGIVTYTIFTQLSFRTMYEKKSHLSA
jgi:hypothetical protein